MAGDSAKSHGPRSYWNHQQLPLTAFPARKATRKQYFAATVFFLKATIPVVTFCWKSWLLLLLGQGNCMLGLSWELWF